MEQQIEVPVINDVRVGSVKMETVYDYDADPFTKSPDELTKFKGFSSASKRRATRLMEKAYTGEGDAKTKLLETEEFSGYGYLGVVMPPYNLEYLARMMEISYAHAAAVKAKVSNIVGLGYDFVETPKTQQRLEQIQTEEKTANARRRLARAKVELMEWLDSRNSEDEFTEVLQKAWTDYEATGNGYIEVGRMQNGQIGYIGHAPAVAMRVRADRDGFVQITDKEVKFFRNFGDLETADPIGTDPRPNEIIHLKKYTPTNTFYGVPDITSAKNAVLGNELASAFNLDYFENRAIPRYIITVKGATLTPQAEARLLDFFQTIKGTNHRTLYIPLPADSPDNKVEFKMDAVEANIQDSSFKTYKRENLNEILMAHRVPISKIGMVDGVSLAMARDADKTFKEQVCRPEQRVLEKKLNKIIKEITDVFILKLNELTLTDEDTQSKIYERYLRFQVLVPNEVRALLGMPGRKGGDKPYEPKPQQAADQKATSMQSRTRDQERSANSPDTSGEARNPQGEGRQVT